MTKKQIVALLKEKGLKFDGSAGKKELEKLLPAAPNEVPTDAPVAAEDKTAPAEPVAEDEIAAAEAKEDAEDKARGKVWAKCEVCKIEVEVANLRKSGCPSCGHSGLRGI